MQNCRIWIRGLNLMIEGCINDSNDVYFLVLAHGGYYTVPIASSNEAMKHGYEIYPG